MNVTESAILLPQMRFYARHGVLPQEQQVGACFYVSLEVQTDFTHALLTDELEGTVSYADIHEAVRQEMAVSSRLLEHVAGRIVRRLYRDFPAIQGIRLELYKQNPPMGADCERAGVRLVTGRGDIA